MLLIALLIWLSVFGHVRAMNPTIAETAMTSGRGDDHEPAPLSHEPRIDGLGGPLEGVGSRQASFPHPRSGLLEWHA